MMLVCRPEGFEGEIQVGIHVDDLGEGEEEEEVDSAGEDEPSASFEADGYRGQQSPTESLDIASRDADEKTNQKYEVKEEVKPVKRTRAKSKTKEVEEEEEEVNDRPQDKELTPLVSSTKTRRSSEEGPVTKAAGRRKK